MILLEELTELRKTVILIVTVSTTKGYRLKTAKTKGSESGVQERPGLNFSCLFPVESYMAELN